MSKNEKVKADEFEAAESASASTDAEATEAPVISEKEKELAKLFGTKTGTRKKGSGKTAAKKEPIPDAITKAKVSTNKDSKYYGFATIKNLNVNVKLEHVVKVKTSMHESQAEAKDELMKNIDARFTELNGEPRSKAMVDVTDQVPNAPGTDLYFLQND